MEKKEKFSLNNTLSLPIKHLRKLSAQNEALKYFLDDVLNNCFLYAKELKNFLNLSSSHFSEKELKTISAKLYEINPVLENNFADSLAKFLRICAEYGIYEKETLDLLAKLKSHEDYAICAIQTAKMLEKKSKNEN